MVFRNFGLNVHRASEDVVFKNPVLLVLRKIRINLQRFHRFLLWVA